MNVHQQETHTFKWLQPEKAYFPEKPASETLDTFPNPHPGNNYWVTFECPEFTSLCPVTGQPDFGHIIIEYVPGEYCVESKSLKLYLFSYRNEHAFHEAVVNRIVDDIADVCSPAQIKVRGRFNPRGGISISVEASRGMDSK